jgi:predicted transcriptional regulator
MTAKERVLNAIRQLPEDSTLGRIREEVEFIVAVDEGMEDIRAGRTVPLAEVNKKVEQWLSK